MQTEHPTQNVLAEENVTVVRPTTPASSAGLLNLDSSTPETAAPAAASNALVSQQAAQDPPQAAIPSAQGSIEKQDIAQPDAVQIAVTDSKPPPKPKPSEETTQLSAPEALSKDTQQLCSTSLAAPTALKASHTGDRVKSPTPIPVKKFTSSLSVNKKFREQADEKTKIEAKPATTRVATSSPTISSSTHPRLLIGKIQNNSSTSNSTSNTGTTPGGWHKTTQESHTNGTSVETKSATWTVNKGLSINRASQNSPTLTTDFPTAAEAAQAKVTKQRMVAEKMQERERIVKARAAASAAANAHALESLDSFKGVHLDPNGSHWDEMDDNDFLDDTIEFGDGTTYHVDNDAVDTASPKTEDLHVLAPQDENLDHDKVDRFNDDYDRSWPTSQPQSDKRALFNDRLGRMEPYNTKKSPVEPSPFLPVHKPINSQPRQEVDRTPKRNATSPKLDKATLPSTSTTATRQLPPHLSASAVDTKPKEPTAPKPAAWTTKPAFLTVHRTTHTSPPAQVTQLPTVPQLKEPPLPEPAPESLKPTEPEKSLEEIYKDRMHAAAERAKKRREEEEHEAQARAERARKKMEELELRLKEKEAAESAKKEAAEKLQREAIEHDVGNKDEMSRKSKTAADTATSWRRPSVSNQQAQSSHVKHPSGDTERNWRNCDSVPRPTKIMVNPDSRTDGAEKSTTSPVSRKFSQDSRSGSNRKLPEISTIDNVMMRIKGAMATKNEETKEGSILAPEEDEEKVDIVTVNLPKQYPSRAVSLMPPIIVKPPPAVTLIRAKVVIHAPRPVSIPRVIITPFLKPAVSEQPITGVERPPSPAPAWKAYNVRLAQYLEFSPPNSEKLHAFMASPIRGLVVISREDFRFPRPHNSRGRISIHVSIPKRTLARVFETPSQKGAALRRADAARELSLSSLETRTIFPEDLFDTEAYKPARPQQKYNYVDPTPHNLPAQVTLGSSLGFKNAFGSIQAKEKRTVTSELDGEVVEKAKTTSLAAPGADQPISNSITFDGLSNQPLESTSPNRWPPTKSLGSMWTSTVSTSLKPDRPKPENSLEGVSEVEDIPTSAIPTSVSDLKSEDGASSEGKPSEDKKTVPEFEPNKAFIHSGFQRQPSNASSGPGIPMPISYPQYPASTPIPMNVFPSQYAYSLPPTSMPVSGYSPVMNHYTTPLFGSDPSSPQPQPVYPYRRGQTHQHQQPQGGVAPYGAIGTGPGYRTGGSRQGNAIRYMHPAGGFIAQGTIPIPIQYGPMDGYGFNNSQGRYQQGYIRGGNIEAGVIGRGSNKRQY